MSSIVRNTVTLGLITMAILGFAKIFGSQSATTGMTGQWTIQATREGRARLQLQSADKAKGRASFHLALSQFSGLTEAQVVSSASRVDFRLVREAGTISFSGSFHDRAGTGQWTFNADPAFVSFLRNHGYEQLTNDDLFSLAISDVRGTYVEELKREGYGKLPIGELVALRSNGVTADDARVLRALVSGNIPAQQLIALKTNDVSAPYIKSLADVGYKQLTAPQLLALRTNGVTRDFIERLEKRGQKNLTVERILSIRVNGGTL
jgi:hypothetical protein